MKVILKNLKGEYAWVEVPNDEVYRLKPLPDEVAFECTFIMTVEDLHIYKNKELHQFLSQQTRINIVAEVLKQPKAEFIRGRRRVGMRKEDDRSFLDRNVAWRNVGVRCKETNFCIPNATDLFDRFSVHPDDMF